MKLYHYTATSCGESILSSSISEGHLMRSDGTVSRGVVWLTTDPRPFGHGLTLGAERLDNSQIAHIERVDGRPIRNTRTLNKTELRITLNLDPKTVPWLMSFIDYCKVNESKAFAKTFGLSCLTNLRTASEQEIKRLRRNATTKEATWWLSLCPVTPDCFAAVDFNVRGQFVPYDFERHGREALRRYGFVFPGAMALQEIAELVPAAHTFERPKAVVFCEDPTKPAKVAVRGGGTARAFEIAGAKPLIGEFDAVGVALQEWVRRHREELMACWADAAELYYDVYPERRQCAVSPTES